MTQTFLGRTAFGYVIEEDCDAMLRGIVEPKGIDVEPAAQKVGTLLEADRIPRSGNARVGLVPMFLERGSSLSKPLAKEVGSKSGLPVKGWVGLDHSIICPSSGSGQVDFYDAETGIDRLEEGAVSRFALFQRRADRICSVTS